MPKKINISVDILYKLYVVEKKSIRVISDELGYTTFIIHKNLKNYGINRSKSDAQKLKCKREGVHNTIDLDIKLLKKLYINENKTTYEVADIMNCSQSKIYNTLKKLGINRSVSEVMVGNTPWNKGKIGVQKHSEETKIKIRLATLNRIKETKLNGGQPYPAYNINSIKYIEKYGKENNYIFQHAENGGEHYIDNLGYWVDGYDNENNVVLEFDESYHNKQKEKDSIRQIQIINHLKCKFIRINENGDEILNINYNG